MFPIGSLSSFLAKTIQLKDELNFLMSYNTATLERRTTVRYLSAHRNTTYFHIWGYDYIRLLAKSYFDFGRSFAVL